MKRQSLRIFVVAIGAVALMLAANRFYPQKAVAQDGGFIVVYAAPLVSSGGSGTCPGTYKGYVAYTLTDQQGWGWVPGTNTTVFTATDNNRTNTRVEYVGAYGDSGCGQTSVTIPYPPCSPAYQFTIYFKSNVPTTNYPITLSGFSQ